MPTGEPVRMNLGTLTRMLRGGLFPELDVPPGPPEDVSHCGCAMPDGCWGDGGWHFARYDKAKMYDREKRLFAVARPGTPSYELRKEWAKWLDDEETAAHFDAAGVHRSWISYIGTPYAYEPCGPYREAVKRSLDAAKVERPDAGTNRRRYEAPANARFPKSDRGA